MPVQVLLYFIVALLTVVSLVVINTTIVTAAAWLLIVEARWLTEGLREDLTSVLGGGALTFGSLRSGDLRVFGSHVICARNRDDCRHPRWLDR